MPLVSFSPGQVISSSNVNANFALCVLTDTSRTVTVTHTYSASQTFTGGWTSSAGCTISAGGLNTNALTISTAIGKIIPGATSLSLRNTADSADNIIVTDAGAVTVRAALTSTGGTTSIRNLKVNCDRTLFDAFDLTDTNGSPFARWQIGIGSGGGSDGIGFYNVTAGALKYEMRASGDFSITTGDMRLQAGKIVYVTAVSKIVPGATSFSHRNNADSADNLLITDAGVASFRSDLKLVTNAKQIYGRNAANSQDVIMMGVSATDYISIGNDANQAGVIVQAFGTGSKLGFYASTGATKQTVTGSRGANAALASLLTALAAIGLVVDSSS